MRISRRSSRWIAIVGILVVLAAGSGTAYLSRWGPFGSKAPAGPVLPARVVLPHMADAAKFRFSATNLSAATTDRLLNANGAMLVSLTPLYDYHSNRRVPRGTKLRFLVKKGLQPAQVMEAYFDPRRGYWVHEPTRYSPRTGVVTARVTHFSVHSVFTWGKDAVKAVLEGLLKNIFSNLVSGAPQPQCGPANGVTMHDSIASKSVLWCDEATITAPPSGNFPGSAAINVELSNARKYPIDVEYPPGTVIRTDDPGSVAQQLGAKLTEISSLQADQTFHLLSGDSLAKLKLRSARPPFWRMSTAMDGEAYLVSILQTALDALEQMAPGLKLADLTKELLKALGGEEVLYRSDTELVSDNLSFAILKSLGDVGLDAFKVAVENSVSWVLGWVNVVLSLANELWQSVQGLVDNINGQAFHTFSFTAGGPQWQPKVDLQAVDWATMAIPGQWFYGPSLVKLHPEPHFPPVGVAIKVPTQLPGPVPDETVDLNLGEDGAINVVYGEMGGVPVAAAPVTVFASGGGTADARRATAYLIYEAATTGPRFIGVAWLEAGWPAEWLLNPRHSSGGPDFPVSASFVNGALVIQELFYGPIDTTAQPTGRGETIWSLQGNSLTYRTLITQQPTS